MLPIELTKNAPRDIDYNHELFKKNRTKVKSIFIGSFLIIPLMTVLFYWKFGADAAVSGALWGVCVTAFFELFAVALMVNGKRSVQLFKDGVATLGTVESVKAPADRQGNVMMVLKISYVDKLGMNYSGLVSMVGKATEVDKKAGDEITVLYLNDKPQTFAIYTPNIGIVMSRSKLMP